MMTKKSLTFAERLRSLRESAGLSQYALAKRSGLSKQAISRLEFGVNEPVWSTVQLLSAALGVSCESFVDPVLLERTSPVEGKKPRRSRKKGE
jgi:transcriptional regulator with XRE-family HTH domain